MRIDLPSGGWVEVREDLKAKDRFAVQQAVDLTYDTAEGKQTYTLNISDRMRLALLGLIITDWSFAASGVPIPANNPGGTDIIGEALDLDDYDALEKGIEPLFAKVRGRSAVPNSGKPANA